MHKRPLAVIAVFFILGIVLAGFLPDSVGFPHVLAVVLVFIAVSFLDSRLHGNDNTSNIFLLLSIIFFAVLLYINSNIFPNNHISHFLGEEKLKTSIVGIIKSPALTRKPYYGKINSTYLFEIEGVKDIRGSGYRNIRGRAQIRIETEKDYGYGDRLLVRGTIKRPHLPLTPTLSPSGRGSSSFNYREYLERQNIFALINTKETNVTVISHNYKSNPFLKYTYLVRARLKNQIIEKMPLESGAFLSAILLGDRAELPKHLQTAFKKSGVYHIFPNQNRQKLNYSLKSYATL